MVIETKVVDTVSSVKSDCNQSNDNTNINCVSERINLSTSAYSNANTQAAVALQPAPTAAPMVAPEKYELLKKKFCTGCNNDEFELFIGLVNRYRLDPFAGEAYCIKYAANKPASIFVSAAGMLSIANRTGLLNGIETNVTMSEDGKRLVSATATVYKKGVDHPFTKTVYYREYALNSPIWQSKPITMLEKVAMHQALRMAFSISGLYGEEEQWSEPQTQYTRCVDVEDVKPQIAAPVSAPVETPAKKVRPNVLLF